MKFLHSLWSFQVSKCGNLQIKSCQDIKQYMLDGLYQAKKMAAVKYMSTNK